MFTLNDVDGQEFDSYEDPNTVAQNIGKNQFRSYFRAIWAHLKQLVYREHNYLLSLEHELGKLGITQEVRGNKIKLGYGKDVCDILAALCNKALKNKRIRLGQPEFPQR